MKCAMVWIQLWWEMQVQTRPELERDGDIVYDKKLRLLSVILVRLWEQINQSFKIYIAPLQDIYSEALPTQAKRIRTVTLCDASVIEGVCDENDVYISWTTANTLASNCFINHFRYNVITQELHPVQMHSHSFIPDISITPPQVHYYPEALPTRHGYYVRVSRRSATGNCEWRTCPRPLRGG